MKARLRTFRYLLVWPLISAYRRRARRSLRWRLAGFNLLTLVAGLATALILVGALAAVGASARKWAEEEPADDARAVAEYLIASGAVESGEAIDPESPGPIPALISGSLPLFRDPQPDQFDVRPDRFLKGVQSIAVLAPELQPDGFDRDEAAVAVIASAQSGVTDLRANSRLREFNGSEGVGAYPLIDASGTVRGVVVIEKRDIQAPQGWAILRAEVRPVVTTVWVGSVVAAIPGLAVAALLAVVAARSVGGRIRDLSQAAGALAEGDLRARVDVRGEDEVASLASSFNAMAERLQESTAHLAEERARAVSALDANRQLVADVSHELRTPVALIRGQVEALGEEHPASHRVEMALREITRLEDLVTDLFRLASAEATNVELALSPSEPASIAREAFTPLVEPAWRESSVKLVLEVPGALPLVMVDRARLVHVLQNLLRNAVRHAPEGGLVRLSLSQEVGAVLFEVSDTGPGIDPVDLPHVFERFYRGSESSGAGLGLAIAREFVASMQGEISVASPPGEGATFAIRLPAVDQPPLA